MHTKKKGRCVLPNECKYKREVKIFKSYLEARKSEQTFNCTNDKSDINTRVRKAAFVDACIVGIKEFPNNLFTASRIVALIVGVNQWQICRSTAFSDDTTNQTVSLPNYSDE